MRPKGKLKRIKPASKKQTSSLQDVGVPYEIVYPIRSRKRKRSSVASKSRLETNTFDQRLDQAFAVRLKQEAKNIRDIELGEWSELKDNACMKSDGENIKIGDVVYISTGSGSGIQTEGNNLVDDDDETDDDRAYDQCWVAQILEFRAYNNASIFARIFWIYRPDDLPTGRLPHHAAGEVFPSNHMDIIDASTIDGSCSSLNKVKEDDFIEMSGGYDGLFWRQAVKLEQGNIKLLNTLDRICVCNSPLNRDWGPLVCNGEKGCQRWLHVECVEQDMLKRLQNSDTDGVLPSRDSAQKPEAGELSSAYPAVLSTLRRAASKYLAVPSGDTKVSKVTEVTLVRSALDADSLRVVVNNGDDSHRFQEPVLCLFCTETLMPQVGHYMLDPKFESPKQGNAE